MTKLVNLTPHPVRLIGLDGRVTVPPSGIVAYLTYSNTEERIITVEGIQIPLRKRRVREVFNLPDPVEGTIYIVSDEVHEALPEREDLVSPTEFLPEAGGQIVGAYALRI